MRTTVAPRRSVPRSTRPITRRPTKSSQPSVTAWNWSGPSRSTSGGGACSRIGVEQRPQVRARRRRASRDGGALAWPRRRRPGSRAGGRRRRARRAGRRPRRPPRARAARGGRSCSRPGSAAGRARAPCRSTKRVCGITPSTASTSSSTASTMPSTRSTSPPKSAWPGVSTRWMRTPSYSIAVFLAWIVMPRSRSRSSLSIARSATAWLRAEGAGLAQQAVDKRRLAVVDVRDDREVADVFARSPRVRARTNS